MKTDALRGISDFPRGTQNVHSLWAMPPLSTSFRGTYPVPTTAAGQAERFNLSLSTGQSRLSTDFSTAVDKPQSLFVIVCLTDGTHAGGREYLENFALNRSELSTLLPRG